ncbi:FAD-binding oxidoreductase, partial [Solicola sp. PLA-1-18]|uniref:FAD-dependent oxidoreductase n=1 Tax=Solicola sp. PLA-1-18 TaxID=3380532 RepID=UPI003B7CE3AC
MSVVGWRAHERAVAALESSFEQIPVGAPVRLAKATTNLFRTRTPSDAPGLEVSGLGGVIEVDPATRTAEVQGMCTYEDLVEATWAHGLLPLVVPQLKTITLGGAVTGLGIESTSFRNGLPHESVLEMDVMTGSGKVVTASPDGPHADLFAAFPNSYGSLGYATRLRIELEAVAPVLATTHVRFDRVGDLADAIDDVARTGEHRGTPVHGMDAVVFSPGEAYLVVATAAPAGTVPRTGVLEPRAFYRTVQETRGTTMRTEDYVWRWDDDWFWCSRAFGLDRPLVRRLWPRRWRRSDVYQRLVALETRHEIVAGLERRRGLPARERVIQDIEVPLSRTEEFCTWFDAEVGMRPVWLCPLRLREPAGPGSARTWPLYPLEAGETYVNAGFWGTVPVRE